MKRKIVSIGVGFILLVILGVSLTYHWGLTAIAKWLIVGDPVVPVDAIVVSTGSFDRIDYAIQLWKQGIAPKILVLSPTWHIPGVDKHIGELVVDELVSQGIPRKVIFTDYRPTSTYEDALYAREWALQSTVTSLLSIEDPFGGRRLRWTFRKVFAGTAIQVYCVAVPPEFSKLHIEKWWTREEELLYVFEEYVKLVLYWIKY